ncbi:MAG: LytTR family DNA-binding domain-containing protein [Clostridia bacterium]|nr:LytTR family DNA-binding domain-containing protein [Clostridia bacterium]MDO5303310.1 LytTR family DNA-binding domain-containing protein [Clostridia bacterium]
MKISIKNQQVVANVSVDTVLFIEKDGRKLKVVTDAREYSYYEKMSNIEHLLDNTFFLCRKGCYINLDKVVLMEDQHIVFENGNVYWLGRDNFIKTKKAFVNFLNINK